MSENQSAQSAQERKEQQEQEQLIQERIKEAFAEPPYKVPEAQQVEEAEEKLQQIKEEMANATDGLLQGPLVPREYTFGEKAAGVSFNPSKDPLVDEVKAATAHLIDLLHNFRTAKGNSEASRYISAAITEIQKGQMLAVKGLTWQYD